MPTFVAFTAQDNVGLDTKGAEAAGPPGQAAASNAGGETIEGAIQPNNVPAEAGGASIKNSDAGMAANAGSSGAKAGDAAGSNGAIETSSSADNAAGSTKTVDQGIDPPQVETKPATDNEVLQALRTREDFHFKVSTVKWFGILCAAVIVAMIGLGFLYLGKIVDASQALQSDMNFSKILEVSPTDSQVVLLGLEHDGLGMRNKRSISALYMRVYTQFLAIIAGTVLALLGAIFVLARVDSVETRGNGTWGGITLALSSSSPGVVVAIVGTLLVGGVVYLTSDAVQVTDAPIFLTRGTLDSVSTDKTAVSLPSDQQRNDRLKDLR